TQHLRIHGYPESTKRSDSLGVYGSDGAHIQALMSKDTSLGEKLHPQLPYVKAEAIWAAREEMARTIEDVLARRTRALFLNAKAALEMAPAVADLIGPELEWDNAAKQRQLADFRAVAVNYVLK